MARTYAAVMALLAMVVMLLRGVKDGAGFDDTIVAALAWMALFGAIGMIVGAIAESTIVESVRTRIETELAGTTAAEADTRS